MKGIGGRRGPEGYVGELYYRQYRSEVEDLGELMRLVEEELSEPADRVVYTFRYFVIEWPHLAFLVFPSTESRIPIGTIVCKQDDHRGRTNRGYIAMLSVDRGWRRRGIASRLIRMAIDEMTRRGAHEIVLETECDNSTSIALYESLGFMREKRLARFYSNGKDA
ncbi:acyl-CoA N-acyltransferase [Dioszegia hungarica]|uniref:Acyl-CoA N-acyltransferase n=1 Tax=Dioszegia hungarica TaxID=4972 RepID=A0AA38H3J3_9TREE|nr:acyl-CoA N-acyltransferase [Dioszegia hungarica]KAI9633171.1 acyl-CoA N-acyltransferase [Dioszegia hungarica]